MTSFRFEREFRGDPSHYWRWFFDERCTREQYEAVGVRGFDILKEWENDAERGRTIHVTPARELPAAIRKLTGASLSFTETTVYRPPLGVAETTVVPHTLSGRISLTGSHRLTAVEDDRFVRVFQGDIVVRLPLVGGRLEAAIVADMQASYDSGALITQAWLDRPDDNSQANP